MKDTLPKTINQRLANTHINTYWIRLTVLVGRSFIFTHVCLGPHYEFNTVFSRAAFCMPFMIPSG